MGSVLLTILVLCLVVVYWMCLYDTNRFTVTEYTFEDDRIRRKCRAVVLADLHNKQYGLNNQNLLDRIRELEPDLILVAGDLLTAHPREKLGKAERFLEQLVQIAPVYYGNGNHEHRLKLYPENYGTLAQEYDAILKKCGVHLLVTQKVTLEEYGIGDMFEMNKGQLRVVPQKFDCDLYHFIKGEVDYINAYRGEYMSSYSWASLTEAYMDRIKSGH